MDQIQLPIQLGAKQDPPLVLDIGKVNTKSSQC